MRLVCTCQATILSESIHSDREDSQEKRLRQTPEIGNIFAFRQQVHSRLRHARYQADIHKVQKESLNSNSNLVRSSSNISN